MERFPSLAQTAPPPSVSGLSSSSHCVLAGHRGRRGQQPSCRGVRAGTQPSSLTLSSENATSRRLQDVCKCSPISHPEPQKELYIPTLVPECEGRESA